MRNKRGLACIILGLALILSAAGLTGYNMWDEKEAGVKAEKAYEELRVLSYDPGELVLPEGIVPAYEVAPEVEMRVVEIGGHGYIGYISIPSLNLDLPVMSEWSYPKMKIAPCRYYGSVYLNNMVIAAHNYANHFGTLGAVALGDLVRFTDVDGNVFDYTVVELEQLQPDQTRDMVKGDDWDLTLFTCTRSGRQRYTVRCVQVEEPALGAVES